MNPLNSKYFPKLMYLALIIVSLLIVFNMANIMDHAKLKNEQKSISGFASEIDRTNDSAANSSLPDNSTTNPSNQETNYSTSESQGMYSTKSYAIYYILIIGIIAGIFITFSVLRSTVLRNIDLEEKARRL